MHGGPIGLATRWKPNTKRPKERLRQLRKVENLEMLGVENGKLANEKERWRQLVIEAMFFFFFFLAFYRLFRSVASKKLRRRRRRKRRK